MKVRYYIFISAAVLLSGCNDFLDKVPDNRTELDNAKTISELLVSAYPNRAYVEFCEAMSDNAEDKGVAIQSDRAVEESFKWKDVSYTLQDSPTGYWSSCYEAIAAANHALEALDKLGGMDDYKEFIHFGLTSQDINNTSVPLSIKEALDKVYYPLIEELIAQLKTYATEWAEIPMLAKTHGQPASPTRLGKEVMVFVYRLERQLAMLKACPITAKFGGATGNYNAHHVAYPQYDWKQFGNRFVAEKLGLEREEYTTQISNYDNLSAVFDAMKRINTIMVDMNRDFWQYISMEYFKQKIKAGEVGSSAMPHKVNPIDFENAEGNLGIATSILEHLAVKLPVSRLQRDLTDSTVLRNVGVPFGHIVIAIQSSLKGLRKLLLNEPAIYRDLDNCWSVVAEAIQTILRREAYPHPYEALKALTRTNQAITESSIKEFIEGLNVSEDIKKELRAITPHTYTGL